MTQMTWTISAKKLDTEINYRTPFKRYTSEINEIRPEDFLAEKIMKEVRQEKKRNLKKYAKILKLTIATSALLLAVVHPALAAGPAIAVTSQLPIPLPATVPDAILPTDIVKVGLYLIGLSTVASTILAIILGQLAGGYRMIRKGDESTKWTTDIIKGYTQVILAPVIIAVIAFGAYLLFGSYSWFLKLF